MKTNKFKSGLTCFLLLLDYKWSIFSKIFNFFTDGRIPKYIKNKIFSVSTLEHPQEKTDPDCKYNKELCGKMIDFYMKTDHSLILGLPRWVLVESIVEEFNMNENDLIFRDFYKISVEIPEKPKNYNFSMHDMFEIFNKVEEKLKKGVEDDIDKVLERMKTKIEKAKEINREWAVKQQEKKNKMIEDMKVKANTQVVLSSKDIEIEMVKDELLALDFNDPKSLERVQVLREKLHQLEREY